MMSTKHYTLLAAVLLLAVFSMGFLMTMSPAAAADGNGTAAKVACCNPEGKCPAKAGSACCTEGKCCCPEGKCQCAEGKCACPDCKCADCPCAKGKCCNSGKCVKK